MVSVWRGFLCSLLEHNCNYVVSVWRGFLLVFSSGSFCHIYRVTDEALIAEAMVWPNFFLMNVFFALKGSKLFLLFLFLWMLGLGYVIQLWHSLSLQCNYHTYILRLYYNGPCIDKMLQDSIILFPVAIKRCKALL